MTAPEMHGVSPGVASHHLPTGLCCVTAHGLHGRDPALAPGWAVTGPTLQCSLISSATGIDSRTDESDNWDFGSVSGEGLSVLHSFLRAWYTGVRPGIAVATCLQ